MENLEKNFIPTPKVGDRFSSWKIENVLSQGKLFQIYEVHTNDLNSQRALLMLRPGFRPDTVKAFGELAKIYAKLDSQFNVTLFGTGLWQNILPFLEMEFVDGPSLKNILEREHKLPIPVALAIVIQVAQSLEFAYKTEVSLGDNSLKGVIHRNIKPANLRFNKSGAFKIVGFGIAQLKELAKIESPDTISDIKPYASPEILNGDTDRIDLRSDIYSLGVILYECLCGQIPFSQQNCFENIQTKIHESYQNPNELNSEIKGALAELIYKSLRVDLDERWMLHGSFLMSAKACLEEITPLGPEIIIKNYLQNPKSFLYTLQSKPVNKKRKTIPLVLGLAVFLFLGLGLVFLLLFVKNRNSTDNSKISKAHDTSPMADSWNIEQVTSHVDTLPEASDSLLRNKPFIEKNRVEKSKATMAEKYENSSRQKTEVKKLKNIKLEELNESPALDTNLRFFEEGLMAYRNGEYQTALNKLAGIEDNSISRKNQDRKELMLLECYSRLGQYSNVNEFLLPEKQQQDAHYWMWTANTYVALNNEAKAESAFEKAITLPSIMGSEIAEKAYRARAEFFEELARKGDLKWRQKAELAIQQYISKFCNSKGKTKVAYCSEQKSKL